MFTATGEVSFRPSWQTKEHIYIHTYSYASKYVSTLEYKCLYTNVHMYIYLSLYKVMTSHSNPTSQAPF